ncbi:hypothetical protein BT69DRAFT_1280085 [Atractiella rhizophila]|nr:hypothetical protein BT69DRAFT_1280085 [Atractiella rhizophila]
MSELAAEPARCLPTPVQLNHYPNDKAFLRMWEEQQVPQTILQLWFGGVPLDDPQGPPRDMTKQWWETNSEFNDIAQGLFAPLLSLIKPPGYAAGNYAVSFSCIKRAASTPSRCLAMIILLDQFPRAIDLPEQGKVLFDDLAQEVTFYAMEERRLDYGEDGKWKALPGPRTWFYAPLLHSEAPCYHGMAKEEFKDILSLSDLPESNPAHQFLQRLVYVNDQQTEVLNKFHRFPFMNSLLGRESTAEEKEWLDGEWQSLKLIWSGKDLD